jgi:Secretion system C-terminal sorting domain
MKAMKIVLVLFMVAAQLFAQERTDATGGEAAGTGGTVSYSVGLIDYEAHVGSNGILTEGVQQPYEIFAVGVDEGNLAHRVLVYPNPTAEYLVLDVGDLAFDQLRYVLYDLNGKFLAAADIGEGKTNISLRSMASATYFLKVLNGNGLEYSFKIIKH